MAEGRICVECGGKMVPTTVEKEFHFNGKTIRLSGIHVFKCEDCGEIVYSIEDARMIERLLNAIDPSPAIDNLNLSQTADLLRVSNQTIYNMIKDGRIKAYKVGREWRFLRSDIMSFFDTACNEDNLKMAAKGGKMTEHDLSIIKNEIESRHNNVQ